MHLFCILFSTIIFLGVKLLHCTLQHKKGRRVVMPSQNAPNKSTNLPNVAHTLKKTKYSHVQKKDPKICLRFKVFRKTLVRRLCSWVYVSLSKQCIRQVCPSFDFFVVFTVVWQGPHNCRLKIRSLRLLSFYVFCCSIHCSRRENHFGLYLRGSVEFDSKQSSPTGEGNVNIRKLESTLLFLSILFFLGIEA